MLCALDINATRGEGRGEQHQEPGMLVDRLYWCGGCNISLLSALSYALDWLLYIILIVVAAFWSTVSTPRKSDFSIEDVAILHYYKLESETYAPLWYLLVTIILVPLIMIVVCSLWYLKDRGKLRKLWDMHMAILGSTGCVASQFFVVIIVKNTAGVPRPDLVSRCIVDYLLVDSTNTMINDSYCLQTDLRVLNDGFRSFPSGHSSTIFASQTFLALFLFGKIGFTASEYFSWKLVLSVLYPLTIALKISFSRISDNRHKIADVLVGDLIGLSFGIFFYYLYFSNPFTEVKSLAFPPRKFEITKKFDDCYKITISSYNIDATDDTTEEGKYTESIDDTPTNLETMPQFLKMGHYTMPHRGKRSITVPHNRPRSIFQSPNDTKF